MIPIKDYNPTRRQAVVVPALIAINVIMFLFVQPTLASGTRQQREEKQLEYLVCRASIPYEITHGEPLAEADLGALDRVGRLFGEFQSQRCPDKSIWASILRSMFLHGGFLHIAGNMLFLWVFGNNVEDRLGRVKFPIFYLLCGLAATLAQTYVRADSPVPMVGASGAIAGVLGAYLIMFPRAVIRNLFILYFLTVVDLPAVVVLGFWFVLQVFQGVGDVTPGSGVAYFAHIGGFLAGMLLLLAFRPRRDEPRAPVYFEAG